MVRDHPLPLPAIHSGGQPCPGRTGGRAGRGCGRARRWPPPASNCSGVTSARTAFSEARRLSTPSSARVGFGFGLGGPERGPPNGGLPAPAVPLFFSSFLLDFGHLQKKTVAKQGL